jgi:hypothetical protein
VAAVLIYAGAYRGFYYAKQDFIAEKSPPAIHKYIRGGFPGAGVDQTGCFCRLSDYRFFYP